MAGLAAIAIAPTLRAADVTTTYSGYATSSRVPLDYWRSNSVPASPSNAVMVALNAEALLLKELLQEHQSRATELTRKNETEKAKWELELVNELREKAGRVQFDRGNQREQESTSGTDTPGIVGRPRGHPDPEYADKY